MCTRTIGGLSDDFREDSDETLRNIELLRVEGTSFLNLSNSGLSVLWAKHGESRVSSKHR